MKPVIIIAIAAVLLIPLQVFGMLDENVFGFTIDEPKGWIREDLRNDGTENIVRYIHEKGNAFLYIALDNSPNVSTTLKGESYLRAMENHFQNNCNCKNFIIKDSKISSSNGKTAYFIVYHSQNFNSESYIITKQIEIPENGKTWRITNQYGGNYYGDLSISSILKSFKPATQISNSNNIVSLSESSPTQKSTKVSEYNTELWLFALPAIVIILAVIFKGKNSFSSGKSNTHQHSPDDTQPVSPQPYDPDEWDDDPLDSISDTFYKEGRNIEDAFTKGASNDAKGAKRLFGIDDD